MSEEDAGDYICTAENVAGNTDAVAVINIISSPVVTIAPVGPLTVYEGQPVRIQCTATGRPHPTITWIPPK